MMAAPRHRTYVWEFPVRLVHWINFLCIITLSITGFYIGNPFIHAYYTKQFVMGWMRFIHFTAAYLFLMSVIIRLYWSLLGNRYAFFTNWFPFSGRRLKDMGSDVKCYLLIGDRDKCRPGHTTLGGFFYMLLMLVFLFMIGSGFAMYSVNHTGAIWTVLGGWMLNIMSLQTLRLYHHLFMYVIIAFAMLHVYIAWFTDSREKVGLMGSIFTGYKFLSDKDME
jgi:Ni/Fe-hydrogenase 1 B-type cytochrome subunit